MGKVSALTAATALTDDDVLYVIDGSTSKKIPASVARGFFGNATVVSGDGIDYTGAADSSTALIALIADLQASDTGGTLQFLPGTLRVDSQLVIPNDGAAVPTQKPMRWVGAGAHFSGQSMNPNGGTILDLRYAGPGEKIRTFGLGSWESTGITYADNGLSSNPYLLTTNTTLLFHHNAFSGNPSKSGVTCDQDAIIGGGPGEQDTMDGTDLSRFQGYGTVIAANYFHRIRRGIWGRRSFNGVVVRDNTWWQTCGSDATAAAIEFTNASLSAANSGNYVVGNLFEVNGYVYGIRATDTIACYFANSFFDPGASFVTCYLFGDGGQYNTVQDVYRSDSHPLMTEVDGATGNMAITSHQSQATTISQPWEFTNAAPGLTVSGLFTASGGASLFRIQPEEASESEGIHLLRVLRSAAEPSNPGAAIMSVAQNGSLELSGDQAGTIKFRNQAGTTISQIRSGGKVWEQIGSGGQMTIDSGTGGSYVDIKGFRLRFLSQAGARKIALAQATPSDASVETGEMVLYFDATAGAPKFMVKAKDSAGTVRTARLDLLATAVDLLDRANHTGTQAASTIGSGTLATARLGAGTADATTFLRGDQTWAAPGGGSEIAISGTDLTALQAAVTAASAGDTIRGTPGTTYTHNAVWDITKAGITLDFTGCAINATVETASAIKLTGDDLTWLGGTLTVATTIRGGALEHHKLVLNTCSGATVRGARIEGAHAAGIFCYGASDFLIEDCTVIGTEADTIHMTATSVRGKVIRPRCYRGGDDGVAVISELGNVTPCTDIDIIDPVVWDQLGGRGVSVVGSERVTIVNLDVKRSWGAGIYIANESGAFTSLPTSGVTVHGGRLTACNYESTIDHGAVFVYSGIDGEVISNITVEGVEIVDAGRAAIAPNAVQAKDGGSTGTGSNIVLGTADSPIRLTGIYNGDIGVDADLVAAVSSSFLTEPPPMVTVEHGATASIARPNTRGAVYWVGSVDPTNRAASDLWHDTDA